MEITIQLPEKVNKILHTLHDAGYEAYAVGGCVRDCILGRAPEDFDITTSAKPEQVKALFRRTVDTGIKHGTVTVMLGDEGFEVTTYRIDGEYEDARHPKEVTFTASLSEDLKRRDFTLNAMAYDPDEGLVDLYGGVKDMERKLIRAVGDPKMRFSEDALRMMRAVRFSAQLDYAIEQETKDAIKGLSGNLRKVSAERIHAELTKLLVSDHPEKLSVMIETGITAIVLPELDLCMATPLKTEDGEKTIGDHILKSLKAVRNDRVLRYTMLFHDIAKPSCERIDETGTVRYPNHSHASAELAEKIMLRLKFDKDTMEKVRTLVYYHDLSVEETPASVRKAIAEVGEDLFPMLLEVKLADAAAGGEERRKKKEGKVRGIEKIYLKVLENGDCVSRKDLKVTGKDLIACGMKPGRQMGDILEEMFGDVLNTPSHNDRDYLLGTYMVDK